MLGYQLVKDFRR